MNTKEYRAAWARTPKGRYGAHRKNAKRRGIPFLLTFDQWLHIWGDKLDRCGKHAGQYVMARFGDSGPYAVGNVEIVTVEQNHRAIRGVLHRDCQFSSRWLQHCLKRMAASQ